MCSEDSYPFSYPEECRHDLDGSIGVSRADLEWLIEKAQLGLDLDAFVTVQADRDRLTQIRTELA